MTAATLQRALPELAAAIITQHQLCEASYRSSLCHALRIGELLLEAKAQLRHGEWLDWLTAHTPISERNAQRYMQLAQQPDASALSGLGIEDALRSIAQPAPAPTDLRAALRGVGSADAQAALAELGDMPAHERFPASAMQRTTWRQIRDCLGRVTRSMDEAAGDGLSAWSRREALSEASRHAREAGALLKELAGTLGA